MPDLFGDAVGLIESNQHEIEAEFLARLGIEAVVRFVSPQSRAEPGTED